jgi:hypothetical protein
MQRTKGVRECNEKERIGVIKRERERERREREIRRRNEIKFEELPSTQILS